MLQPLRDALLVGILLCSAPAFAEIWPSKSLRVLVGYAPGGSVDLVCRAVLTALPPILGQQVVIDNRPGNASILAAQAAARSSRTDITISAEQHRRSSLIL